MLRRDWQPGEATVVAARLRPDTGDGLNTTGEFELDVRPRAGESFRAVVGEPYGADFWPPRPGDVVRVLVDVRRRRAKFDRRDPALSFRAHKAATGEERSRALSGGPVLLPDAPAAPPRDAAERLMRLEELHRQGLVTEAEYAVQRQRLSDG